MKEEKKHIDAFYYFFNLLEKGYTTSQAIDTTAEYSKVTSRTVWNWYSEFGWEDRAITKRKKIVEQMEEESNKTLAENRLNYLKIFHKLLDNFIEDDFPADISSIRDLEIIIKTCLVLQDAPSEVTKTSNINHNIDFETLFDDKLIREIIEEEEENNGENQ